MDTIVALYDAVPDPLPTSRTCFDAGDAVACDDDGGDEGACSRLAFTAPADGTYWVRVFDYLNDDVEEILLAVRQAPEQPIHQRPAFAISVAGCEAAEVEELRGDRDG